MPRHKTLPDAEILTTTRALFAMGGEKAISFGNLSRATGLAASTLAQRFGSVEKLQGAAALAGWKDLEAALEKAERESEGKGPQALLKLLEEGAASVANLLLLGRRATSATEAAAIWRGRVETALQLRIGQSEKARQSAQLIFAAWQGRIVWGMEDLRLKDMVKRFG